MPADRQLVLTKGTLKRDRGAIRRVVEIVAALALVCGAVALVQSFAQSSGQWGLATTQPRDVAAGAQHRTIRTERYHQVLEGDDWIEDLRSGRLWKKQSAVNVIKPNKLRRRSKRRSSGGWSSGTYRTVCVRLCDGYYFPISTATRPDRFRQDERSCRARCEAPTRLFVHKTRGGSADDMIDIRKRDYVDLENAFRYRITYDPSCKCRAHPWEVESKQRHARYATDEVKKRKSRDEDKISGRGRRAPQVAGSLHRAPPMALGASSRRSKLMRKRSRRRKRPAVRRSDWRKSVFEIRD